MTKQLLVGFLSLTLAATQPLAAAADCGANHATKDARSTAAAATTQPNVLELAASAGFGTLSAAVEAAGLGETLSGPGPFTIFAPTDAAFAKLPAGAVEALLGDTERLRAVLLHHVVPGSVMAADVVKLKSAKTAGGTTLAIAVDKSGVKVAGATVTQTDIAASNGVIHVIDTVLLP